MTSVPALLSAGDCLVTHTSVNEFVVPFSESKHRERWGTRDGALEVASERGHLYLGRDEENRAPRHLGVLHGRSGPRTLRAQPRQ